MNALVLMVIFLMMRTNIALAEASVEAPSWLSWVSDRLPGESIAWMLAFFGLLNGLSEGLGLIDKSLTKYAAETPSQTDDKVAAVLHKIVDGLRKFLVFSQGVINFFTAKAAPKK